MVDFNEWSQDPFALFAAFLTLVITVTFISGIIFLFDIYSSYQRQQPHTKVIHFQQRKCQKMEQEMPDYETICAAVVGEKWALEKVLDCYGDEINRLAMVKKCQPDGTIKEEIDEDLRQTLIMKLLEAIPQFPMEKE